MPQNDPILYSCSAPKSRICINERSPFQFLPCGIAQTSPMSFFAESLSTSLFSLHSEFAHVSCRISCLTMYQPLRATPNLRKLTPSISSHWPAVPGIRNRPTFPSEVLIPCHQIDQGCRCIKPYLPNIRPCSCFPPSCPWNAKSSSIWSASSFILPTSQRPMIPELV